MLHIVKEYIKPFEVVSFSRRPRKTMAYVGKFRGYEIYVSETKHKKYYALVDGQRVNFGDLRYQHYHDKMGHYASLDHWDKNRRRAYKTRHEKDRHTEGTAGWFADNVLW